MDNFDWGVIVRVVPLGDSKYKINVSCECCNSTVSHIVSDYPSDKEIVECLSHYLKLLSNGIL